MSALGRHSLSDRLEVAMWNVVERGDTRLADLLREAIESLDENDRVELIE